ncbi:MAG TPA: TonB-dependent receptor, partial [Prolixibacteraceae bacterium]|nr:TonB-dependent receptor [Prolixibacteraceae bacterium]
TSEQETYDIIGYYWFNEVGNEGTEEQNDSILNLGVGTYQEHGRNYFNATVASIEHKGKVKTGNNFLQWGVNFKEEYIDDRMKEWQYHDSAGYSLPYANKELKLYYSAKTDTILSTQRLTAFLQDSYSVPLAIGNLLFTGGLRAHYWTFTDKVSISPRLSASLKMGTKNDIIARLSFGWYYQPAFYRELKNLDGVINRSIQTPKSIQAVAGVDFSFMGWDRPFKMTTEAYYKSLKDLIPYQYENVRIRYLSDQISNGFAYGLDMKVNGEFVSGTQSWISMSLMKTMEDIVGDGYGYIRRPNDQRFKFSMFFQDYLPGLPAYQMHLTGHYITGVPYGMPRSPRYMQQTTMNAYKRVDIGFLRLLVSDGKNLTGAKFFDHFKSCSVGIELYNILGFQNVSSYTFIADYDNVYHPVPDRLTGRMLNLKITAEF